MRFVSLFAGIGGFDLGLERAGMTCVGQVEIDPYCTRVLEKHWPTVPRISDIHDFQGNEFGEYDLLCGGYPCQPFSHAGKRGGETDERHLWPEVARIIRATLPRWVLLENVPGHLSLGFDTVLGELAESGYDAEWDCIPASSVGAPHRRDRVWIVAYPTSEGRGQHRYRSEAASERQSIPFPNRGSRSAMAHPEGEHSDVGKLRERNRSRSTTEPRNRHTETRRRKSDWWASEPNVGRVAHGVPSRVDRLRALGNAVVPQIVEAIGGRIMRQSTLSGVK